jgi:hypothetical protein
MSNDDPGTVPGFRPDRLAQPDNHLEDSPTGRLARVSQSQSSEEEKRFKLYGAIADFF